jgi:fibronectin type 3 domain-containing protein
MSGRLFTLSFRRWLAGFLNPKPTRLALRLRARPEVTMLEQRVLPDAAPTEFFNFAALDGRWLNAPAASGDTTGVTDTANLQRALNTVGTGLSILSATESGNTVTITTATPHGYSTGDSIAISFVNVGNNPLAGYDGVFQITVTDPTHFTYFDYNSGLANNANGGTASRPNVLVLSPGTWYINQTLTFDNRSSVFVYGSDPGTTILQWVGPVDGTMLEMYGCHYSAIDRLTFDGGGQADVGIWNALNKINNDGSEHYDGANEYADDVFQNLGIGLRENPTPLGSGGGGPGEFDISRDQFIHCTTAGIDIHGQNTLDQWVRDSRFIDCTVGVSSHDGFGGNWSVSDCVFLGSTLADLTTGIPQYWLISGCYSRGSNQFLQTNASDDDITIQNSTIIDPTCASGAPIDTAYGGSSQVLLLGNTIRTPAGYGGPAVSAGRSAMVFADANTFGVDGSVVPLATLNPYGDDPYYQQYTGLDTVIDRSQVSDPGPPALPPTPPLISDTSTWNVLTVGATPTDATVAGAVQDAVAYATNTGPVVVHIPEGVYLISSTLTIPATTYPIELIGDGQYIDNHGFDQPGVNGTRLLAAGGLRDNPEIELTGPSLVAISQISVLDANANGVSIQMTGIDGVAGSTVTTNYLGTGYNTGAGLLVNGQSGNLYVQNQDIGTTALFGGGWTVQVVNGSAQVADFFGNDGGPHSYDVENGGRLLVAGQYIDSDNGAQYAQVVGGTLTVESGLTRPVEPVRNMIDAAGTNTSVTLIGQEGGAGDGVNVLPGATANVLVAGNVLDERFYGGSLLADYAAPGTLTAAVLENTYAAGLPRGGSLNQWTSNITDLSDFVHQQLAAVYAAQPEMLSNTWNGALTGNGNGASDVRLWDITVGSAGSNPSNAYGIVIGSTTISPPPSSPVVQDGGFEVPSGFRIDPPGTPWTYTGSAGVVPNGNGTYTSGNGAAPDGGQVGFLQNNATVSQNITVNQTGWYTLSFYTAQSAPQVSHGNQTLDVYLDGTLVGSVTPGGTTWQAYTTNPFQITPTGSHTIELAGTVASGGATALVDVVTLGPGVSDAPLDLTATAVGSSSPAVTVSWSAPLQAASSYTLYRGTSPGTEIVYQTGLTNNTYTDTGVTAGTTYYYKVAAVNAAGASATFGEVSATPSAVPNGWTVSPGASANNSGGVGGTWTVQGPGNNSNLNYVYESISATVTTVLKARVTGVTSGAEAGLTIQGSGGYKNIYVNPNSNVPGIYGRSGNHSTWPPLSGGDVWLAVEVYPANGQLYYYDLYSVDGGNTWLPADTYSGDGFGTITGWTNLTVGFVLARSGPSIVTASFDSVTVTGTALIPETYPPLGSPPNLTAVASGTGVTLSWSAPLGNISQYDIYRSTSPTAFDLAVPYATTTATSYTDTNAPAGVTWYYDVTAQDGAFEGIPPSGVGLAATASAVRSVNGGAAQRSNPTGWYGARITIGSSDIVVGTQYTLARWGATGGQSAGHTLEFVDAATDSVIGSATNSVGGTGGTGFLYYWTLSNPVTLLAGHSYYLVSSETNGGDNWLDSATVPPVSSVLTVDGPVSSTDNATWNFISNANNEWVGLDFRYTIVPASDLVTGVTPGGTTAGTDEWAGAVIQVGSSNVTVTSLGRLVASDNTQTHTVELVDGSNNAILGSVVVDTSVGTAGQFTYAPLASAVMLLAGHTYYVVSQEFSGGDSFSSQLTVTTTSAAADLGAVSNLGDSLWNWTSEANTQTVGVDFLYTIAPPTAPTNLTATARTDFRGVNLSWAPSLGGITSYSVYRGTSPGAETALGAGSALTGYTDVGLTPGATYYYKVLAYRFTPDGSLLASPLSAEVQVTVNNGTTLAAPTNVTATADGSGRIVLSWTAVSGATGYNIYRTTTSLGSTTGGGADSSRLAVAPYQVDVRGTSFTDDNLLPGSTYYYRVTAIDDTGSNVFESGFVPTAIIAAPPNGAIESGHTVTITTTTPHGFSVGQVVRIGGVGLGGYNDTFTITAVPTPTSFQFTDPAAGLGNSGGGTATASEVQATTATTTDQVHGLTFQEGVRNDFTGWVGGNFRLHSDITVYALGRYVVPGNTQAHTVELVDFTGGGNTVAASVTVNTVGATPGQIAYAGLAAPVTLLAGHTYRLVSSETSGGDYWYDHATQLTTTSVASETSAVGSRDNTHWHRPGQPGTRAGQQFVGLDFRYTIQGGFAPNPSPHVSPGAGLTDRKLAPVDQAIRFVLPHLPHGVLGETTGLGSAANQTIHLDAQAAGYGWSPAARSGLPDVALDTELPVGVLRLPAGSTTPVAEGIQLPGLVPGAVGTEGTSVSDTSSDPLGMGATVPVATASDAEDAEAGAGPGSDLSSPVLIVRPYPRPRSVRPGWRSPH